MRIHKKHNLLLFSIKTLQTYGCAKIVILYNNNMLYTYIYKLYALHVSPPTPLCDMRLRPVPWIEEGRRGAEGSPNRSKSILNHKNLSKIKPKQAERGSKKPTRAEGG